MQKKCGSNSPLRVFRRIFRRTLRHLVRHDNLPDYFVALEDNRVVFRHRGLWRPQAEEKQDCPLLEPETYHGARTVAPGYDAYCLEQERRDMWVDSDKPSLGNPDKAFIAFCRKRYERNPNP